MSATTVLSLVGVFFFTFIFSVGLVYYLFHGEEMNGEIGRNLMFCLMGAVLCAYLGGW